MIQTFLNPEIIAASWPIVRAWASGSRAGSPNVARVARW